MPTRDETPADARQLTKLTSNLAANLRRLRADRGWSQEEAAFRSDVAVRPYTRLERGGDGNPTLATIVRLGRAFGVDPLSLLAPPVTKPVRRRAR